MANPRLDDGFTRIANEIMEHLIGARLSGAELAIALAVIRLTFGWNRTECEVSLTRLQSMTTLTRGGVRTALKSLQARGVVRAVSPATFKSPATWAYTKDWEQWTGRGDTVIQELHSATTLTQSNESDPVLPQCTSPVLPQCTSPVLPQCTSPVLPQCTSDATQLMQTKENQAAKDSLKTIKDMKDMSTALHLAELLRDAIRSRDPAARAGKLQDLSAWARDVEMLIRIDGRTPEEIREVIIWSQAPGCFWGPNILSGKKLREKFDTMAGQKQRDRTRTRPDTIGAENPARSNEAIDPAAAEMDAHPEIYGKDWRKSIVTHEQIRQGLKKQPARPEMTAAELDAPMTQAGVDAYTARYREATRVELVEWDRELRAKPEASLTEKEKKWLQLNPIDAGDAIQSA